VLAAAVAATVACALPTFLVGALAVQIRQSMGLGASTLGELVAVYYLGAASTSLVLGRLVESVGYLRVMRISCCVSSAALVGVATAARSAWLLGGLLVTAGIASSALQPAANAYLSTGLPARRQGLAFGIKQSAIPLTALLAGLSVPGVALTIGWRYAFALAGIFAAAVALLLPRRVRSLAADRSWPGGVVPGARRLGSLWVLAAGFGLGVGSAGALSAFLASSAVSAGMASGRAGLLLAAGGAASVLGRLVAGWRADRREGGHLSAVAIMLLVGAAAYGALAASSALSSAAAFLPVAVVAFSVGWGWNGLFNFAVVANYPDQPAWATGVTQMGGRVGGVVGPLVFGQLVQHFSYATAWAATGLACLASAAVIFAWHRHAESLKDRRPRGPRKLARAS
jgi:MFS family permease